MERWIDIGLGAQDSVFPRNLRLLLLKQTLKATLKNFKTSPEAVLQ